MITVMVAQTTSADGNEMDARNGRQPALQKIERGQVDGEYGPQQECPDAELRGEQSEHTCVCRLLFVSDQFAVRLQREIGKEALGCTKQFTGLRVCRQVGHGFRQQRNEQHRQAECREPPSHSGPSQPNRGINALLQMPAKMNPSAYPM